MGCCASNSSSSTLERPGTLHKPDFIQREVIPRPIEYQLQPEEPVVQSTVEVCFEGAEDLDDEIPYCRKNSEKIPLQDKVEEVVEKKESPLKELNVQNLQDQQCYFNNQGSSMPSTNRSNEPSSRSNNSKSSTKSQGNLKAAAAVVAPTKPQSKQFIKLHPSSTVSFKQIKGDMLGFLILENTSYHSVAFKVKTNAPANYTVSPNMGILLEGESKKVKVKMVISEFDEEDERDLSGDLFKVVTAATIQSKMSDRELQSYFQRSVARADQRSETLNVNIII